jgi:hypothetical protein
VRPWDLGFLRGAQILAVSFVLSSGNAAGADEPPECHAGRVMVPRADAAQAAAETDKAISLFKSAVEQFEICRPAEWGSGYRADPPQDWLDDTVLEVYSASQAAMLSADTNLDVAQVLSVTTMTLLAESCDADRVSRLSLERRTQLLDAALLFNGPLNKIDGLGTYECAGLKSS